MTTETTENNVTELPAPKQRRQFPFVKKNDPAVQDATETVARKGKAPHGIYTAGVLLLVAGGVAAVASKLGRKSDVESSDVPSDVTETNDN